ncbi:MAG: peptidoglycan recognition protein [Microthrixaceae bacterium]
MRCHPRWIVLVALALAATLLPSPAFAEVPTAVVDVRAVHDDAPVIDVDPFDMIAVSWRGDPAALPTIKVHRHGTWTSVASDAPEPDAGPDDSSREARRSVGDRNFGEPVWVGDADGYRVTAPKAGDVRVHLIRSSSERVLATALPAAGASVAHDGPSINSRGSWGAAPPKAANSVATSIRFAVVHHTAGTNDYGPGDVPAILRGIQAFHQNSRGWNDIAYNFLIDRWGGIWQGRDGDIGAPVVGAHAAGFNTGTVGVSLMGDFSSSDPPQAMIDATASVVGWKLALSGVNPRGTTTVLGTTDNKFPTGQTVTIPTVVGHRDVGQTDCPGRVEAVLDQIRAKAAQRAPYVTGVVDRLTASPDGSLGASGWAFDRRSSEAVGIRLLVDGRAVASSTASAPRPDVATAVAGAPGTTGYSTAGRAGTGSHTVCVAAAELSYGALTILGCTSVTVASGPASTPSTAPGSSPIGSFDSTFAWARLGSVTGWAIDPDTSAPIAVHVSVNGRRVVTGAVAAESRPDVAAVNPGAGDAHGFKVWFALDAGPNRVCVDAVNVGAGTDTSLGCRDVPYDPNPLGGTDAVSRRGSQVQLDGWALDRDTSGGIGVLLFVNNRMTLLVGANRGRFGVGMFFPGYGDDHGFRATVTVPRGRSTVCAFALNVGPGRPASPLGCRSVRR